MRLCHVGTFLCLAMLTTPADRARAQGEQQIYRAICDASAAIAIGPSHFIVADDETDVLATYEIGKPEPVARVDLVEFLGNRTKKGKAKEADLEGATRIGQRIYWIASHGRDSSGDLEPTRHRFFATDISGAGPLPDVKPVGSPYTKLLDDLIGDPRFAELGLKSASELAPEEQKGLGIEGLASTPEGGLLIGFRNPRPAEKAIVIPLLNPAAVIEQGAKPQFGEALRPDLEGRGIRSIERVGDGYLIVGGPFGKGAKGPAATFALHRWSGGDAQPLKPPTPLSGRPEALFVIEGQKMMLLSDDGDELVDGKACKHKDTPAAKKSFRATIMPLK